MLVDYFTREPFVLESFFAWTSPQMMRTGQDYFSKGRVTVDYIDSDVARLHVQGNLAVPFPVVVNAKSSQARYPLTFTCPCPTAISDSRTPCAHKVAAAVALRQHFVTQQPRTPWRSALSNALAHPPIEGDLTARRLLIFSLQSWGYGWRLMPYSMPLSVIPRAKTVQALAEFPPLIAEYRLSSRAQPLQSNQADGPFYLATPQQTQAAKLLAVANTFSSYSAPSIFDSVIPLITDALLYQGTFSSPLGRLITIAPEPGHLSLELAPIAEGMRLQPSVELAGVTILLQRDTVEIVSRTPLWMLLNGTLAKIPGDAPLLTKLLEYDEIVVPEAETVDFAAHFLAPIAERIPVHGGVVNHWQDLDIDPICRVYLREDGDSLVAELRFGYGDYELGYERELPRRSVRHDVSRDVLVRIQRRTAREEDAWNAMLGCGLKRATPSTFFTLRQSVHPVDFLLHQVPKLQQLGFEVFGEEELTAVRVNRSLPSLSMRVSSGIDWFDVEAVVQYGDLAVSLAELRRAMRKKERFVKLPDGSLGQIPKEWQQKYRYLFEMSEETSTGLRLNKSQATLLDLALAATDQVEIDEECRQRCQRLRDFTSIAAYDVPAGFHGELRPYQKTGFDWLHFLHDYQFGGCLADDMGIGKTVQALAFLQSLKERDPAARANLIVMPRSLLINWAREAERFTPELRVLIHADGDRLNDPAVFNDYDLVLTTYGIVRRDIELLRQYRFHYLVLDEAQAVKNPLAQSARATRALLGDHHLALTGTPVENSTSDLWALFAFLNPGLLGAQDYFRKAFALPIERQRDEAAAKTLRALVYPFILRRSKAQVAPELPPRTEKIIYCEMEPAQRKVYTRWRDQYRALLLGLIDDDGLQNARMKVLEGLLRLRQLCNHPRLVDKEFKGDSAKFDALLETLENLRAEGHKALIFSQFTSMLKIIREELDARHIPYRYLDGHTIDRQERVDEFQQDESVPFFLISLKAGGVGLNLTAADYVIHIDPWWNPAVEQQATDRTHRIGQERPVMVYKMIARDSVEEKILRLQERKQALVEQLITTETSFMKALTREDVASLFS